MFNCIQYKDILIGKGIRSLPGWSLAVYLYVVDGLLIDFGPESMKDPISKFLQEKHIEQVALTHIHEDHSGMAAWLQRQMNVPIYLHEKAIPEAKRKGKYQLDRHLTWGQRPAFDPQPMPERLITDKYTKSLKTYREKFQPRLSIRTSMTDYKEEDWVLNLPLYGLETL